MPGFAGIFAWFCLRGRQGIRRWCGYGAIVVGLACLTANGDAHPLGLLALVTAAAMWAIYTLLFRRSKLTPVQSAALICFWSTAIFLPIYRSEEHTSELQSLMRISYAVFCLKQKKKKTYIY